VGSSFWNTGDETHRAACPCDATTTKLVSRFFCTGISDCGSVRLTA
jgi:hypothetical protein